MLAQIDAALANLNTAMTTLSERVAWAEKWAKDLEEFSERFDEVMTRIENERRLDFYQD